MRIAISISTLLSTLLLTTAANAAELDLAKARPVPLGKTLQSCIQDSLHLQFLLYSTEYGDPIKEPDTVVLYDAKKNLIHVVMLGGSETADGAKLRLESRLKTLKGAVTSCESELGVDQKEILGRLDFVYTRVARDKGKSKELLRWYQGKWELL